VNRDITLDAAIDSPQSVVEVLHRTGCVLLRNALPRGAVLAGGEAVHANAQRLHKLVGREVNDMPLCFADRQCSNQSIVGLNDASLIDFTDPLQFSGFDRSWFYEGERNYKRWFWENGSAFPNLILGMITRSILPTVYHGLYRKPVVCSYSHCAVRYQRVDLRDQSYAFHQDASYNSRDLLSHSGLTTWIPLTDCGIDAPSLQLYPRALDEVLPLPPGVAGPYLFCDHETVFRQYGDELWAPEISAGDVLIFNHLVVHRSYITENMVRERQSADVRVFPLGRVPEYVRQSGGWCFELPCRSRDLAVSRRSSKNTVASGRSNAKLLRETTR
jgi:hypothetical protein